MHKADSVEEEQRQWEKRLEREDEILYFRDFSKDPVFVSGSDEDMNSCSVGCKFGFSGDKKPDAAFNCGQIQK
ncbi:hypothetical protein HPP92_012691 [Vanilla planifolia]|nr:hypothetical protein HPP92_012691 [Vanilla planifolia]